MKMVVMMLCLAAAVAGFAANVQTRYRVGERLDVSRFEAEQGKGRVVRVTNARHGLVYYSCRTQVGNADVIVYVSLEGLVLGVSEEFAFASAAEREAASAAIRAELKRRHSEQIARGEVVIMLNPDESGRRLEVYCLARSFAKVFGRVSA